jgi:hypothetical protein
MSDATGHMDRPGAGPLSSSTMAIGGIPINHYIHDNPITGRVEIVRPMPPGVPDQVVKEFPNRTVAWACDCTSPQSSDERPATPVILLPAR